MTMDANPPAYTMKPPVAQFAPTNGRIPVPRGLAELQERVGLLQQQNEYLYANLQTMAQAVLTLTGSVEKLNQAVAELASREPAVEQEKPKVDLSPLEHVARLRAQHGPPQLDDRDLSKKSGYGADMDEDSEE